jgi:hypothetical protein
MTIPMPPGVITTSDPEEDKKIPAKTVKFILDKHLHRIQHRHDPTVLKFIDGYMQYLDIRQAAQHANIHYKDGKNLRNRPDIAAAINELVGMTVDKFGYTANEVVERTKEILNFDPAVIENPDGTYKDRLTDIPFEMRTAIRKFKVKNEYGIDANGIRTVIGRIIEIELYDKQKAADMLGKEKDVFKDSLDINQNVKISITGALKEADERLLLATARDVTGE